MLLDPSYFEPVFAPFAGKRVGYVQMFGNVGDRLIDASAMQLFTYFNIDVVQCPIAAKLPTDVEEYAVAGGGNMGTYYTPCNHRRQEVFRLGKPVTVLPQSFTGLEDISAYKQVWVRERASLQHAPDAGVAPDLALGYTPLDAFGPATEVEGIFLRIDREKIETSKRSLGDPAHLVQNYRIYLCLAATHQRIITNRLHFAIAGLLAGRDVVLLPNCYHKNRSMYDTWLKDLGCRWLDTLEATCLV